MPAPLEVLVGLRMEMQMGRSVNGALEKTLAKRPDVFSRALYSWLERMNRGQDEAEILNLLPELTKSPQRRAFVTLIKRGLAGSPIDGPLGELENEFYFAADHSFEKQLQLLPLKLLIPLTLFILPGVMLLLLGPLISILRLE